MAAAAKEVTTRQVRAVRFGFYSAEEVRQRRLSPPPRVPASPGGHLHVCVALRHTSTEGGAALDPAPWGQAAAASPFFVPSPMPMLPPPGCDRGCPGMHAWAGGAARRWRQRQADGDPW